MALERFSVWSNRTITASEIGVNGNGEFELACSNQLSNNNNLTALRLVVDYESGVPESSVRNWDIFCVVEGNNGESGPNQRFFTIGHQFEPYRRDINGKRRILLIGQNVPNAEGVDDIVFIGTPVERISRQSSKLPQEFRVRMTLRELGYGTSGAFQSITLSVYGEKFDG